jgi:hypothetical protein
MKPNNSVDYDTHTTFEQKLFLFFLTKSKPSKAKILPTK